MRNTHLLKIQKPFLQALVDGRKTHEIRYNDRDYQVGDILSFDSKILWSGFDTMPAEVDGKSERFEIIHILNSAQFPDGLKENYVILSLKKVK